MYPSPEAAVDALYRAVSFEPGASIDFDALETIFVPGARLIHVAESGTELLALEEFCQRAMALIESGDRPSFEEVELWQRVDRFGHMAQVLSTFEMRDRPDGPQVGRGVHAIQLLADGEGWRIISLVWQNEDDRERIPREMLP